MMCQNFKSIATLDLPDNVVQTNFLVTMENSSYSSEEEYLLHPRAAPLFKVYKPSLCFLKKSN